MDQGKQLRFERIPQAEEAWQPSIRRVLRGATKNVKNPVKPLGVVAGECLWCTLWHEAPKSQDGSLE